MSEATPALQTTIPILLTGDMAATVAFFERLAFTARFNDGAYAILHRDAIELHFSHVDGLDKLENRSECRINVMGINAFYAQCQAAGAVHPNGALKLQPYGLWEFALLDPAGICVHIAERA